jgi:hypothetical protein
MKWLNMTDMGEQKCQTDGVTLRHKWSIMGGDHFRTFTDQNTSNR